LSLISIHEQVAESWSELLVPRGRPDRRLCTPLSSVTRPVGTRADTPVSLHVELLNEKKLALQSLQKLNSWARNRLS